MISKIYTEEEIKYLKQNPFVREVEYNRFINYDPVFKLWCVLAKMKYPEMTCRGLFYAAGFPIEIMNPALPQRRIKSWMNTYARFGEDYFLREKNYEMLDIDLSKYKDTDKESYFKLKRQIYSEVKKMLNIG